MSTRTLVPWRTMAEVLAEGGQDCGCPCTGDPNAAVCPRCPRALSGPPYRLIEDPMTTDQWQAHIEVDVLLRTRFPNFGPERPVAQLQRFNEHVALAIAHPRLPAVWIGFRGTICERCGDVKVEPNPPWISPLRECRCA